MKNRYRAPLTTAEELERTGRYYSEDDIDEIADAMGAPVGFKRAEFTKQIEGAAWWAVNTMETGNAYDLPPSQAQRKWASLANRISGLADELRKLPLGLRADMEYAADALAKKDNKLPDFEPRAVTIEPPPGCGPEAALEMTIWPHEEQIDMALRNLIWMGRVLNVAAQRSESDISAPGNRPNEPEHTLYRTLVDLFRNYSPEPLRAYTNRETDEPAGNLIDYLECCLRPLGFEGSRTAIYATYYRALKGS